MKRTLLIAVVVAVLAAAVATGATIVLTGDDPSAPTPTPAVRTPAVTTQVIDPTPPPRSPGMASPSPSPEANQTDTPAPTPVPRGSAAEVDCEREPELCSDERGRMEVIDGALVSRSSSRANTDYSNVPRVSMTWRIVRTDDADAEAGDRVDKLLVTVTVTNDTARTFVFPRREVALDVLIGGRLYDRIQTSGEGFDMTPGSRMTADFERPIVRDGIYTWRAKTWYYAQ